MFKQSFIFLLVFITLLLASQNASANTFIEREILWNKAQIIEFDTASEDFDLKIWIDSKGGSSLRELMESVWGITGITWVFQCPKDYSACGWVNHTINERYVDWKKISVFKSTWDRVVFWWNEAYEALLFQTNQINPDREWEIFEWLANHPPLLVDGEEAVDAYWGKWLIDEKMRQDGTRNFICSNKDSSKIYFGLVYQVNIDEMVHITRELGCYNAINLDAGFSTAMIHNGDYIAWPGREILDWVFIVPKHINTQNILDTSSKIATNINSKINRFTPEKKIEILEELTLKISNFIQNIYSTRSSNIYEEEWNNWAIVWTRTEIWKEATERIYLLNSINLEFYYMIRDYTEQIKIRESTPAFDLKF